MNLRGGETRPGRTAQEAIVALDGDGRSKRDDAVAVEEPLEIRLTGRDGTRTLAVTMRTPGNDFELAAGFAYCEGILASPEDLVEITYCLDESLDPDQQYNVVTIELRGPLPDLDRFERHFTINSSCGVCGRAQLESLHDRGIAKVDDGVRVSARTLYALPERMRAAQRVFAATGGLHAAALFDERGELVALREDVGRHNALDKLIGWGLLERRLPFARSIVLASGRASYEIVQKCLAARVPVIASVSAPSSLAIDVARDFGITLAGFLRGERANVYSVPERVE